MSCTYTYNGRKYSREGMLRQLAKSPSTVLNSESAKSYLAEKLGMSGPEVEIVTGLIENRSLGRFMNDGKILLSSMADDAIVRHEAFHRVWRMYVTKEERKNIILGFRNKADYKNLIQKYTKDYQTEEEQIEEYFADEFANYSLNEGDMKTHASYRNVFQRLFDFLKKLVGLKSKSINDIYKSIEKGEYKSAMKLPNEFKGSANKFKMGDIEISAETKNDIVQTAATLILNDIFTRGSVFDLIDGKIDFKNTTYFRDAIDTIGQKIFDNEGDDSQLGNALYDDYDNIEKGKPSLLLNEFQTYMNTIGITFNIDSTTETDEAEDVQQHSDSPVREFSSSLEIDPKTSMSRAIKLMLASLTTDKQNTIGFNKQVGWSKSFNELSTFLAGIPNENQIEVLSKLNRPYINRIIDYIGGIDPKNLNLNTYRLRTQFIETFDKNLQKILLNIVEGSDIFPIDANSATVENRIVRQWNNYIVHDIKTNYHSYNNWQDQLRLMKGHATKEDYLKFFGIKLDESIDSINGITLSDYFDTITSNILNKKLSNTKLPDYKNIFGKTGFDVQDRFDKIAEVQAEFEEKSDIMIFFMGNRLYPITLNTHITNTLNRLNFVANLIKEDMPIETKIKLIQKYVPDVLNAKTVDANNNITSKWLQKILNGEQVKLVIMGGIQNKKGDEDETANVNESDLYSMMLNNSLKGKVFAMKHSDRSIFYGYDTTTPIFDIINGNLGIKTKEDIISYLSEVLYSELENEVRFYNTIKNGGTETAYQHVGKNKSIFGFDLDKIGTTPKDSIMKQLVSLLEGEFEKYNIDVEKYGLLEPLNKKLADGKDYVKGISNEIMQIYNHDIPLILASSFANEMLTHLEEMKVLHGDFNFYKNGEDLSKRLSTASSTGNNMNVSQLANETIANMNNKDVFDIYNPITKELEKGLRYSRQVDGGFNSMNIKENDNYRSKLTEQKTKSVLTGKEVSIGHSIFEQNLMRDLKFENPTEEQIKFIESLAAEYTKQYENSNENDGQSWANIFFIREFMMRLGRWNNEYEKTFQIELKILNAISEDEIADIEIDGKKVFDINNFMENIPMHTLKTQHSGYSYSKLYSDRVSELQRDFATNVAPYTIGKTSIHPLMPSLIKGTNLEIMNHQMLTNGIDTILMSSSQKTGGIDAKKAMKLFVGDNVPDEIEQDIIDNGFEFYNKDGQFNHQIFERSEHRDLLTVLNNFKNIRDQVRIEPKVKEEIKGSTQSLKNMVSNLFSNGEERFPGAADIVQRYKDLIANMVETNIKQLMSEFSFNGTDYDSLDKFVNHIKKIAIDKGNPQNIIEAIETFGDLPYIESLPNKDKIENMLHSIIKNGTIDFNRPGNSYPQVASTGYEKIGEREVTTENGNRIHHNSLLKFYEPVFDKDGNIQSMNPAEIILPFPKKWLSNLMKKYPQANGNVYRAIQMLNADMEEGKQTIELKGLRIPNQQLSSNDFFRVKRFNVPTAEQYVIVPTELVVKTGSD